jgi:hypothetical protein
MVLDRQLLVIERDFTGFNDEAAGFGHGVARVDAQVHDDLFDLGGIGADDGEIGSEIGFDFNTAADDFFQEADGFGDVLIEIDVAGLQNLAAGEGEEPASERGSCQRFQTSSTWVLPQGTMKVPKTIKTKPKGRSRRLRTNHSRVNGIEK